MSANTFGHLFQVSTFGESHGVALGALIQGCPAGVPFDLDLLSKNLKRRRPGQSSITTARKEADEPQILSGVYEGKTLGTPMAIVVYNKDKDSSSYKAVNLEMRKGHATDLWQSKFGHSDPRGSGRASGRETLSRVLGGSVAQMALKELYPELKTFGFVSQVGPLQMDSKVVHRLAQEVRDGTLDPDHFTTRIPEPSLDDQAVHLLNEAKASGDSFGGMIDLFVSGVPKNLGQPVFKKLKSELASAILSVGAVNSVEIGFASELRSFSGARFHGQEDVYGGLRGGITTGEDLHLRVGFKPPATLGKMALEGRHDPCILPRAVPVLESMVSMVLMDQVLWTRLDRIK